MTEQQIPRIRRPAGLLAGVAGIIIMATVAAQAFTFNDQSTGSSNGTNSAVKFGDPADRTKARMSGSSEDKSTIRNGNTTLQFGGRESFDQRNSTDRYFSPDVLMGR